QTVVATHLILMASTECMNNQEIVRMTVTLCASEATTQRATRGAGVVAAAFATAIMLCSQTVQAQLRVDISGVGATQYPIAVADFANTPAAQPIGEIIRADLSRSGQFQLINATGANLTAESQIDHDNWRNRGADYVAYGSVAQTGGQYQITYRLVDAVNRVELDGIAFAGNEKELRRMSHRIADRIYEKITGIRGVFSTRIAYVLQTGDTYELQIA